MPSSPSPKVLRLSGVGVPGDTSAGESDDEETVDDLRPQEIGVLRQSLNDGEWSTGPALSGVRGSRSSSDTESVEEMVVAENAETTDMPLYARLPAPM